MTKLKWDRKPVTSILNSDYFLDPKNGFDKAWHEQQKYKIQRNQKLKESLGIHESHDWQAIQGTTGPHAGKAICNTCGGKFIMWLPKGFFSSNT